MFDNCNLNFEVKNKNREDRKTIIVRYSPHDYMPSDEEYFYNIFDNIDGIIYSWHDLGDYYENKLIHVFVINKSNEDKLINVIKETLLGLYEDGEDEGEIIKIAQYCEDYIDFSIEEIDGEICEIERDDMLFYIPNINNNLDYDEDVEQLIERILDDYATLKCNSIGGWSEIVYFLEENDYNEYMALQREIYSIDNELDEIDKAIDKHTESRKEELLNRFKEIYEMICEE
ncbi:hypothetical protein [Clostridium saccharobutylicum]|uniref:Uncharacterized protein n=1 Tax=Clostridium saccharobutylicum DSM 13864 TaxID=1345695 RepID=U5MWC1_CLOSA|nr:hypothetical protein [Clostridium saccharobutylicum]AGX43906.1 hypothetical protein CLSA_c29390 [Clostridium saccharobutylicum DSM 13864]AQR91203.1 hypothetical protein CLOSC_29270 [Clostridium saccharobutylicum]AQS01107.1 hypothetical protein CSACC_29340 [Clostridium saccharobutylicum]AQS15090.1 hypothetical protein CLOSACC_29340 [Clostridium saccharobutylicum]MBA2905216.1 hypothetical protein [Clostridium saccharobutylicum]